MEANCYSLCFILYKTSCPELLVIVSCRNLGTKSNCVYKKAVVRRERGSLQKRQTPNLGSPKAGIDRHLFK